MTQNKVVATGLIATLTIAILTAVFEASIELSTEDSLYMLAGLGMFVFGIWASVLLLKKK